MAVLALVLVVLFLPTESQVRLANLSHGRQDFNDKVVNDKRYETEDRIYTMPLDVHVVGFYPVGVSNRRYLIEINGDPKAILFQQISGTRAWTKWRLELQPKKRTPRFRGTIAQMLARGGVDIKGKVTDEQGTALNTVGPFAAYDFQGPTGSDISAWLVKSDGSSTSTHAYQSGDPFPIVDEEAALLGLGRHSWPTGVQYRTQLDIQLPGDQEGE